MIAPTVSLGACGEDPMKALARNLLEDRGKERQRVLICLSTDMILKPRYWERESPRIHISKTLILAPLTAGLAFTLTSRQLLLQISHGNFILLTIFFPPPPLFLAFFAGLWLLTGCPKFPSELGVRGELIPDPGFHHFLKEKKKFLTLFSCSWSRKKSCIDYRWTLLLCLLVLRTDYH